MPEPLPPNSSARSASAVVFALAKAFLCGFIHLAAFLAVASVAVKCVPVHEHYYRFNDMDLFAPTMLVLHISQWMVPLWWIPDLFFLIVNPVLFIGLYLLGDRLNLLRRVWFAAVLLLAIFYLWLAHFAVMMPWANDVQRLAPPT